MPHTASTPNLSPTFAEMAARSRSTARNCRYRASLVGEHTPSGRALLAEAAEHDRMNDSMKASQAEVLAARDGMLTEYRKFAANKENARV